MINIFKVNFIKFLLNKFLEIQKQTNFCFTAISSFKTSSFSFLMFLQLSSNLKITKSFEKSFLQIKTYSLTTKYKKKMIY